MSFILDALKKSDHERKRGEVPTISSTESDDSSAESNPKGIGVKIIAIGFALTTIVLGGVLFLGGDEPDERGAPPSSPEIALNPPPPETKPEPGPEIKPEPKLEPKLEPKIKPSPPPSKTAPEPSPEPVPEPVVKSKPAPTIEVAESPVIKSPPKSSLPQLNQASRYLDRGWESMDRGLYNQAVADFSSAVEMEPGFSDGWFALGWAQEKNKNDQGAIASYTRAINERPDHTGALFSRGYLELFSGNPGGAVNDFSATLNLSNGSLKTYSYIWLYIARSNAGLKPPAAMSNVQLSVWPGPMVNFYAGKSSEAEVLGEIESGNSKNQLERRCAGYFFLGEHALIGGDVTKAKEYFKKAMATGAVKLRQFDGAMRELAKLGN